MPWTTSSPTAQLAPYDNYRTAVATIAGSPPVVTIAAMPYTRTVAMGSITITGSCTNTPTSMSWSASPSGASGTITPAASWSASISISPSSAGQGVETITVTASNASGSDTDTVTIGFYVAGAHTWFNSQNINGSYNSGMVNNDAITTWENLGSSALDVTQATSTMRPLYNTNVVGGQPVVTFQNDDELGETTVANWTWTGLTGTTFELAYRHTDTGTIAMPFTTFGTEGAYMGVDLRSTRTGVPLARNGGTNLTTEPTNTFAIGQYNLQQAVRNDAGTPDATMYGNGTSINTVTSQTNVTPNTIGIRIGRGSTYNFAGAIWQVRLYQTALSATELGINEAVDEWALGASFPVTP